ncbi:MAG TPA: acyl-CoA thioesterase [Methylomirabilota bacterium]|nr:acyl-CoA thioesterase [Methylomirabilota bacterium]
MDLTPKAISASRVAVGRPMQPPDANAQGNVHGGVILRMMDEAAGIAVARHTRGRAVTAAIDSFSFLHPVHIGDFVTVHASINWVGRSSLEVGVRVEAEDLRTGEVTHTGTGRLIYVSIDEHGRPRPVPPLVPETDEDRRRVAEAAERQKARLVARAQAADRGTR